MARLSRPDGLPDSIAGILGLGEEEITVLGAGPLFGLAEPELEAYTPLIVLRSRRRPLAMLVDRVVGLVKVPREEVRPVSATSVFGDGAACQLRLDGQTFFVLDPDSIEARCEHDLVHGARMLTSSEGVA